MQYIKGLALHFFQVIIHLRINNLKQLGNKSRKTGV